jgi:hypothetical protein
MDEDAAPITEENKTEGANHTRITLPEMPNFPSVKRFAECNMSGTRQTDYLPSVTLGKERH